MKIKSVTIIVFGALCFTLLGSLLGFWAQKNSALIKSIDEMYLGFTLQRIYYSLINAENNPYNVLNAHKVLALKNRDNQQLLLPSSFKGLDKMQYEWLDVSPFHFIAHRGGNVLLTGSNTIETFLKNKPNYTFFELDVYYTNDGHLILYHRHSLDKVSSTSSKDIEQAIRTRGWTPTYLKDVVAQLSSDKYIILDIKSDFKKTMRAIEHELEDHLHQLIPQIYSFKQLDLYQTNKFAGPIFTSYRSTLKNKKIFNLANKFGIKAITLTKHRIGKMGRLPQNVHIFTHAVDSLSEAFLYKNMGVDGFYTKVFFNKAFPEFNSQEVSFYPKHFEP